MMSPTLLMVASSLLFALMGVCVKFASAQYSPGELVFYRSLVGFLLMGAVLRAHGVSLRTPVPAMHFWRSASGVTALCMWFYALGNLPLATAMTLNYMSSVWIALFLIGGAVLIGSPRAGQDRGPAPPAEPDLNEGRERGGIDGRLVAAVLAGFVGVAMKRAPTSAR